MGRPPPTEQRVGRVRVAGGGQAAPRGRRQCDGRQGRVARQSGGGHWHADGTRAARTGRPRRAPTADRPRPLGGNGETPQFKADRNRRLLLKVYLESINENIPFKTVYVGPSTYAGTIVEVIAAKAGLTEPTENFYLAEVHNTGGAVLR